METKLQEWLDQKNGTKTLIQPKYPQSKNVQPPAQYAAASLEQSIITYNNSKTASALNSHSTRGRKYGGVASIRVSTYPEEAALQAAAARSDSPLTAGNARKRPRDIAHAAVSDSPFRLPAKTTAGTAGTAAASTPALPPSSAAAPGTPAAAPAALTEELLVPIRLDIDMDGMRLLDSFSWNLHERSVTPAAFAKCLCGDLDLSTKVTALSLSLTALYLTALSLSLSLSLTALCNGSL
jgi:hypothetical protein